MRTLYSLSKENNKAVVTAVDALRKDILPWLLVIVVMALLTWSVVQLVLLSTGVYTEYARHIAQGVITGRTQLIIMLAGCFMAVRSKGWQLWATYVAAFMLTILLASGESLINYTNVPLMEYMIVVVMILASSRLAEYIKIRYRLKLEKPRLTGGAIAAYIVTIVSGLLLVNSLVAQWVSYIL